MAELKIDGKTVQAADGETILTVARREGFVIPTLCYHEALGPIGRCRLCSVEVTEGDKTRVVASCIYQAKAGMVISTDSEGARSARKKAIEALVALAPASDIIQGLARAYGAAVQPQAGHAGSKCIQCTQCVKTCKSIVGVNALEMSGKGDDKKVAPRSDSACIACGACAVACPTGHIVMKEANGTRNIWGRDFALAACPKCGRYHAPQGQLQWIASKTGVPVETLLVCPDCK